MVDQSLLEHNRTLSGWAIKMMKIERETGIPRSSVQRIVKQDLQLKTCDREDTNENFKLNENLMREVYVNKASGLGMKTFTVATPSD